VRAAGAGQRIGRFAGDELGMGRIGHVDRQAQFGGVIAPRKFSKMAGRKISPPPVRKECPRRIVPASGR
jgi:hypothetical protein